MSITINHQTNEISATSGSISIDGTSPSATQDQATWEAGTSTTETIVSPAKVKAAIDALVPASSSGFEFIATADASNDATIVFTGFDSSKYDGYLFIFSNIRPQVDSNEFFLRTSSNGGSSYDSGASDYTSMRFLAITGDGTVAASAITQSFVSIAASVGNASTEWGVSGQLYMPGPHLSAYTRGLITVCYRTNSNLIAQASTVFERNSTSAVNAIQFGQGGNIGSGTITMYGMKNA